MSVVKRLAGYEGAKKYLDRVAAGELPENGKPPNFVRAILYRLFDDCDQLIRAFDSLYETNLVAVQERDSLAAALTRFRAERERLLARIEFASQPIGNCGHCLVGNKPGPHHLPDCPAFAAAVGYVPSSVSEAKR